jgi:GT2 family glycosyltransferase
MTDIPVSIIIPNYNGEQILAKTLASVVEAGHAYPGECEIIVVDDASQDNSIKLVTENFPEINIVRHDTNKGFAEAVHTGTKSSTHAIIILLNSDVRPDRNFIAPLVRRLSRDNTFSVSPLILDHCGKALRVSWNLGKIVRGEIRKRNWDLEDAQHLAHTGQALKSLYASGGSIAFKKEMFLQLGGFLPLYKPFYYEDRDLCTRAWRRGWQTFFEPESTVVHDHQGTIKRFYPAKRIKIIRRRNRFFYLWLHLSASKLFFSHFPWIFFRLPLRLLQIDTVYAIALFKALPRLREVLKLRGRLEREYTPKSLEEIIKEIGN